MKNKLLPFLILLTMSATVLFTGAIYPAKNNYMLTGDYSVVIHGISNLHNWVEKVGIVKGEALVNWNSEGSFNLDALNIKMDVHSIKSEMGSVMDNNTYKALKAETNPEIIFILTVPVKSIQSKSNKKSVSAKGNFTIAGITRLVDMQVKIFMEENGKLAFEGIYALRMTDYGVNPPTAFFGTLKTGNEITINFKVKFAVKPA